MLESALELHPEALEEALAGYAWYLEHSETTADRFFGELERAVRLILQGPHRWSAYLHGTRRMVLVKFPYSVVYRARGDVVVIYAFAHAKRRAGYWRKRLGGVKPLSG